MCKFSCNCQFHIKYNIYLYLNFHIKYTLCVELTPRCDCESYFHIRGGYYAGALVSALIGPRVSTSKYHGAGFTAQLPPMSSCWMSVRSIYLILDSCFKRSMALKSKDIPNSVDCPCRATFKYTWPSLYLQLFIPSS